MGYFKMITVVSLEPIDLRFMIDGGNRSKRRLHLWQWCRRSQSRDNIPASGVMLEHRTHHRGDAN